MSKIVIKAHLYNLLGKMAPLTHKANSELHVFKTLHKEVPGFVLCLFKLLLMLSIWDSYNVLCYDLCEIGMKAHWRDKSSKIKDCYTKKILIVF